MQFYCLWKIYSWFFTPYCNRNHVIACIYIRPRTQCHVGKFSTKELSWSLIETNSAVHTSWVISLRTSRLWISHRDQTICHESSGGILLLNVIPKRMNFTAGMCCFVYRSWSWFSCAAVVHICDLWDTLERFCFV